MTAGNRLWGDRTLHEVFGTAARALGRHRGGVTRDIAAVVLMVIGVVAVLIGAWAMWGWPAAMFTSGLGCLAAGIALGTDVIGD